MVGILLRPKGVDQRFLNVIYIIYICIYIYLVWVLSIMSQLWISIRAVNITSSSNDHGVLNNRSIECLFSNLFRLTERSKVCITVPLWGESTGDRWIPCTKGTVTRKIFPLDYVIMKLPIIVPGAFNGASRNIQGNLDTISVKSPSISGRSKKKNEDFSYKIMFNFQISQKLIAQTW